MRADSSEERRAHAMELVLLVRDVRRRARVAELLRQPKVDHVHHLRGLARAHDKVRRLDVAVHDRVRVDKLYARYLCLPHITYRRLKNHNQHTNHRTEETEEDDGRMGTACPCATERRCTHQLVREQQHRLEREVAVAPLEEVLERRPEEVDDHDVVVALPSRPHNPRDARATHECLVYLRLLLQRTVLRDCGFELDGDLLARDGVHAEEHGACRKPVSKPDHRWQHPPRPRCSRAREEKKGKVADHIPRSLFPPRAGISLRMS